MWIKRLPSFWTDVIIVLELEHTVLKGRYINRSHLKKNKVFGFIVYILMDYEIVNASLSSSTANGVEYHSLYHTECVTTYKQTE